MSDARKIEAIAKAPIDEELGPFASIVDDPSYGLAREDYLRKARTVLAALKEIEEMDR